MRARLKSTDGFGLIELMIAMTVLAVGLLALVAAFSSGYVSIRRASNISTASALADTHMERFRALRYCAIRLDDASIAAAPAPYTSDAAYSGSATTRVDDTDTCNSVVQTCVASPVECNAARAVTGPDSRSYRIDTYMVYYTPTGGRELKVVTVVVRDSAILTGTPLARLSSRFDASTG